jgi:hypothetical protein
LTLTSELPDSHQVICACEEFDRENRAYEDALKLLFTQYRRNGNLPEVLLKVVVLNRLYNTGILAVFDVANHIVSMGQEIDARLAAGSPDIVDIITKVTIGSNGKTRNNWSFAAKYCSWHESDSYPIWDSRVDTYLKSLRETSFAKFLRPRGELWDRYAEFVEIVETFVVIAISRSLSKSWTNLLFGRRRDLETEKGGARGCWRRWRLAPML